MTMIRDEISTTGQSTTTVPSPLDAMLWLRARLHTHTKRKAIEELLKAEQHRLDDLGITRVDIREALASEGDASQALHRVSAKRRCNESRANLR